MNLLSSPQIIDAVFWSLAEESNVTVIAAESFVSQIRGQTDHLPIPDGFFFQSTILEFI